MKMRRTFIIHLAVLLVSGWALAADPAYLAALGQLSSPNAANRFNGINSLAKMKDNAAVNALVSHYNNEGDPDLKIRILEALSMNASTSSVAVVIAALKDPNEQVRQSAAISMRYFGGIRIIDKGLAETALTDTSENVRLAAAGSLGLMRSSTAVEALDSIIKDKKNRSGLRKTAAQSLESMGTAESDKKLMQYSGDTDKEVRKFADKATQKKKKSARQ
jgi:HEAT repeat protein